jgi:protein SCO1/2
MTKPQNNRENPGQNDPTKPACGPGCSTSGRIGGATFCQLVLVVIFVLLAFAAASNGQYLVDDPKFEGKIDVVEHLGEEIPVDLPFVDSNGDTVSLRSVLLQDDLPAMLVLHYSDCPMLCGLVLNGVSEAARSVDLVPGREYRIVSVSIDPLETPQRAKASEKRFNGELPEGSDSDSWRFLVGPQSSIDTLANALGFIYFYDEKNGEYAHPALMMLLTPEGRISRYLYGIEFNPRDVKLGLLEAGRGKIGDPVDKLLLYCFHYDPDSESYVVFASNVMRVGGAITLALLALLLGALWWRDHRHATSHKSRTYGE